MKGKMPNTGNKLVIETAPWTNGDRIRSMTDEELAVFIRDQIIDRNIGIPSETWLDWLRQEVDNAEDQPAT